MSHPVVGLDPGHGLELVHRWDGSVEVVRIADRRAVASLRLAGLHEVVALADALADLAVELEHSPRPGRLDLQDEGLVPRRSA